MPPAVARHRVRLALRRAREAAGRTQAQVAGALDWSLSKVNRIEAGEVNISTTDLQALLRLLGIDESAQAAQLLAEARQARSRGWWWEEARYREGLTPGTISLIQYEMGANEIRVYNPTVVPGMLQTRQYAERMLEFWDDKLTPAERKVRLEVRMRRRDEILTRPDPPRYYLILDESVMYRQVGGPRVMADQLRELTRLAAEPHIIIRVAPFSEGLVLATLGPFIVFDLGDEENATLYREYHIYDEVDEDPAVVGSHRNYFEQMWYQCLTPDSSVELFDRRITEILRANDRGA
jgi:transcriptional regulator with XRE-family HTH domain